VLRQAGLVPVSGRAARIVRTGDIKRRVTVQGVGVRPAARAAILRRPAVRWPPDFQFQLEANRVDASRNPGQDRKIRGLKRRAVFLLLALVVYRIARNIPVPLINPDQFRQAFESQQGGILGLLNMFSGGALSRFSVLSIGIMPYISASIIMQMLTYVLPSLESLRKEGESGRRK